MRIYYFRGLKKVKAGAWKISRLNLATKNIRFPPERGQPTLVRDMGKITLT